MKKLYFFALFITVGTLSSGCLKDLFKPYEERIEGSWELTRVRKIGIGGGIDLPFTGGHFTFYNSGQMDYYDQAGNYYSGSWDIRRERNGDDEVQALQITLIDFQNQQVKTEFFNDMAFRSRKRFVAYIYTSLNTYTFNFERE